MMIRYRHVRHPTPSVFQLRRQARIRRERQELADLRKFCFQQGRDFEVERRALARWKRDNRLICWACALAMIISLWVLFQ